ncbi:hypothetical protein Pth03_32510 [Planotetraspora thailandica]|uniref:Uncharacterized protein n=1 Tax=Planotetraspora thailandica TaxID=487172 RepID=A0A8J3XTY8_9ACTN|nr:hypothetical protein [Planotetraspora thailandica]GII54862.1 hypothetical protein Pth03_32510 [Planotetraspora thailandica]
MRIFALPVTLIIVAGLIYVLVLLLRGARRDRRAVPAEPRWEVDTVMENGWTLVVVKRIAHDRGGPVELARQTVRAIPDDDPHWDERYREALVEARSRATTLSIGSD